MTMGKKLTESQLAALKFLMGCVQNREHAPTRTFAWAPRATLASLERLGLVETVNAGEYRDVVITEMGRQSFGVARVCRESVKTPVNADTYADAAQALYWYCSDWHSGQDSELYSIMSARLGYTPGMSERGPDADTMAPDFYAELESGTWDATELCAAIDAAYAATR